MGAGPYPTSEPEVRSVVDFITRHTNITGGTAFHTWSGVLLRPFEHLSDEEMHAEDLWVYQAMGKKGTEIAKEAATLILLKDDLQGMVEAIALGRRIYGNL
jgi:hypothetical protein